MPSSTAKSRNKPAHRPLMVGTLVVLAAVALTAIYSRRANDGGGAQDAASSSALMSPVQAAEQPVTGAAGAEEPRTVVSFLLDRSVTRGLYLGDRWVSPEVFHFAQPGTQYVVRAKLQSVDAQDEYVDLRADWSTDDPGMIAITRHEQGDITVLVRQPGSARLFVSAGGRTKTLQVKARRTADAMDVAIQQ